MNKLCVAIILHANHYMAPHWIKEADEYSYEPVLTTFLENASFPVNLHFSGTLLNILNVSHNERIRQIKEGLKLNIFELLGSSYAQNILYASNTERENIVQLGIHKGMLQKLFGVEPRVFWNAERCWYPSIAKLVSDFGYVFVPVESHILQKGIDTETPLHTLHRYENAVLLCDQEDIRPVFNNAVNTGDIAGLRNYLSILRDKYQNAQYPILAVYAEDLEAWGAWAKKRGEQASIGQNLCRLLKELQGIEWLEFVRISDFYDALPETEKNNLPVIEHLAEGAAGWMNYEVRKDGYTDWYDYVAHHSGIVHYKTLHRKIWKEIENCESFIAELKTERKEAATKLLEHAKWVYANYQYEFGCSPGSAGDDKTRYLMCEKGREDWEMIRTAFVSVAAAKASLGKQQAIKIFDVNADGIDEIVMSNGSLFVVLSEVGGRILYLIDLDKGTEWMGGEFLIRRDWSDDNEPLPAYNLQGFVHRPRVKGFVDDIKVDDMHIGAEAFPELKSSSYSMREAVGAKRPWLAAAKMESDVDEKLHNVTFKYTQDSICIAKKYSLSGRKLSLEYTVTNNANNARSIKHIIENGFYISPMEALLVGNDFVQVEIDEEKVLLRNEETTVNLDYTLAKVGNNAKRSFETYPLIGGHCIKKHLEFCLESDSDFSYVVTIGNQVQC